MSTDIPFRQYVRVPRGAAAKAGDVPFIPAERVHAARSVATGRGAELATYIVENKQAASDTRRMIDHRRRLMLCAA